MVLDAAVVVLKVVVPLNDDAEPSVSEPDTYKFVAVALVTVALPPVIVPK